MKKSGLVFLALACALIIFGAFIKPAGSTPTDPPQNIPDSVWAIVKKSCYDCHSNDGNSMAAGKLNFDKWDEYSPDKQLAKALDMCDEVQKGKMPPSKYHKNNPEAVPTDAEAVRICNWVKQIEK